MARRSEHSRERIREMALAAAERIVDQQGHAGLSTRKVAVEIGYAVGSLYLVFRNLDDLVLQMNARTLDELSLWLDQAVVSCREPEECLLRLARAYLRFASEHKHRWRLIFEHQSTGSGALPDWYMDRVKGLFAKVEDPLGGLAPKRSREAIALAARALWSGVHGICILGLTGKLDIAGVRSVEALAESLITNYLVGFIGSGGEGR